MIKIEIKGIELAALIDTGSEVSAIFLEKKGVVGGQKK